MALWLGVVRAVWCGVVVCGLVCCIAAPLCDVTLWLCGMAAWRCGAGWMVGGGWGQLWNG